MERKRLSKGKALVPAKHTKEELLARFKGKGGQGRPKGTPNKVSRLLKDAILRAAELEGMDGHGKQGLEGYLRTVARQHKKEYVHLLAKLLPLEMQAKLIEMQLNQAPNGQLTGMINIKELSSLDDDELRTGIAVFERITQGHMATGGKIMRTDRHDQQAQTIPKGIKGPRTIEGKAVAIDAS